MLALGANAYICKSEIDLHELGKTIRSLVSVARKRANNALKSPCRTAMLAQPPLGLNASSKTTPVQFLYSPRMGPIVLKPFVSMDCPFCREIAITLVHGGAT
jgi:hypothetical protein